MLFTFLTLEQWNGKPKSDPGRPIRLFASGKHLHNSLKNNPNCKSADNKNTPSRAGHHRLAPALL
jgi:hypothetical protein